MDIFPVNYHLIEILGNVKDLSDIHYSACWLMQKREFDKQQDSRTQKGDA